tara:strand:+ start:372 stop:722 length:351 start_codon:yes stop_codon:yes gene_type:complete
MKSLFSFSSGGGSGFPGAPVAGLYIAPAGEFLAICAEVLSFQYSIVVNAEEGGIFWYSDGSQMILQGGSVTNSSNLPMPGTAGGVVFSVPAGSVALADLDSSGFWYFDGADWVALN